MRSPSPFPRMTMRSPLATFSGKEVSADAFHTHRPNEAINRILDNIKQ